MPVINDPAVRAARAEEKRTAILRFLRTEIYTTPLVIAELIGVQERAARQTILSLEKAGLVRRHSIRLMQHMPPVVVIGITQNGQSIAFDPASGELPVSRYFEPSKYSLIQLQHNIDLQRLRLLAENSGLVESWMPGAALGSRKKGEKNPDGVIQASFGPRIALELERSIKSQKRYRSILRHHLESISSGRWYWVIWVSPNESISSRIRALLLPDGKQHENGIVDTLLERHRDVLVFTTYDNFIDCMRNIESMVYPSMPEE